VTVDCDPDFWANGHFRWSASLTRITDGALPLVENTYALNGRANSHSVTIASSTPWISRHVSSLGYYKGSTGTGVGAGYIGASIARPPGANTVYLDTTLSTTAGIYTASWIATPANWYTGAAGVQVSYDSGSTYYPVVGRQIRYGHQQNSYLGNIGLRLRVTSSVMWGTYRVGATTFEVETVGSESDTAVLCIYSGSLGGTTMQPLAGASILRNAPHVAAIRMSDSIRGGYVDAMARRGSAYLECHWADKGSLAGGVITNDGGGHTAITGGTRRTSNDADGNKIVVLTTKTKTNDLTSGGFTLSTGTDSLPFAIGFEVDDGGSPGNGNTANDLIYQYFGAVTESVRLVTR